MPPGLVIKRFFGNDDISIRTLNTGLVNDTYLVFSSQNKSILQRLNKIFSELQIQDFDTICNHLASHGWDAPSLIRTKNGSLFVNDKKGRLWRHITFIDSDNGPPREQTIDSLELMGNLLGRWHKTMNKLKYKPAHVLHHFHDTSYYALKLKTLKKQLPDEESRLLASIVLQAYEALPKQENSPVQLIHGDPQVTNMLFRGGKPFTYIDLDTVMRGSIWLDIGDLLRATLETDFKNGVELNCNKLMPIINGYRNAAKPKIEPSTFQLKALRATQLITLELIMRFLVDVVEDNYFSWDKIEYGSKRDNHMHLAYMQWEIFKSIQEFKKGNI